MLPRFKGRWIPRLDNDETADMHRAMILLMLKSWRYLPDLHRDHESWEDELSKFMYYGDQKAKWTAYNLQSYHEGQDGVSGIDEVDGA